MTIHSGYNDAWETIGWTAQNMAYPVIPNLPDNEVTPVPWVWVRGVFEDREGRPLQVQVRATPSVHTAVTPTAAVLIESYREVTQGGKLEFKIPVGNWDWTFRMRVGPATFERTLRPVADVDLRALLETGQDADLVVDGGAP